MDEIIEYEVVENKNSHNSKTTLSIVVSAIALGLCVLGCIVVLISAISSKEYIKAKYNIIMDLNGQVFVDDTAVVKLDNYVMDYQTNFAGTYGAFLNGTNLYVVDSENKSSTRISTSAVSYRIAASGDSLAYIDDSNTLYLYNLKRKTQKTAESGVLPESLVVSPNGKYVGFVKQNADVDTYVYNGSKSRKVAEDKYPVAVSNDGKYVYCENYNNKSLYVYPSRGDQIKLTEYTNLSYIFNCDATEIVYSDGENVYFSKQGSEGEKLFEGNTISLVLPENSKTTAHIDTFNPIRPIKSFEGQFITSVIGSTRKTCFIGEDFTGKVLCETSGVPKISSNKRFLVFVNVNGGISRYDIKKNQTEEITQDGIGFAMSNEGKKIYFVTSDKNLMYKQGKNEVKIAEDVSSLTVSGNKYLYYVVNFNVVHRVTLGKTKIDDFVENGRAIFAMNGFLAIYDDNYNITVIK